MEERSLTGPPLPPERRPDGSTDSCPCRPTLDRLADRWSAELIGLLVGGPRCAGELQRATGATRKVLTETLRALERDGLLEREVLPDPLVRVRYSLTPLGASLAGPLAAIRDWSQQNLPAVAAARARYESREDRPGVTALRQERARTRAGAGSC
jgi:DNA-binding HxlR family transcriptional regulator